MFTSAIRLSSQRLFASQPSVTAAALRSTATTLPLRSYSQPASLQDSSILTWSDFFKLRKQQRRINVGSSLFTALLGCNVSWAYLSTMEIEPPSYLEELLFESAIEECRLLSPGMFKCFVWLFSLGFTGVALRSPSLEFGVSS